MVNPRIKFTYFSFITFNIIFWNWSILVKSQAYSGTVIQHGYLELKTTSSSTLSTISKIAAMVQDAQMNVSPTEIMMNKFASYYTPLVVLLAAIVFLIPLILHLSGAYGGSFKTWGRTSAHRIGHRLSMRSLDGYARGSYSWNKRWSTPWDTDKRRYFSRSSLPNRISRIW